MRVCLSQDPSRLGHVVVEILARDAPKTWQIRPSSWSRLSPVRPAQLLFDPGLAAPGIALIRPDQLDLRKVHVSAIQHERDARSILHVCSTSPFTSTRTCRLRPESFLAPS